MTIDVEQNREAQEVHRKKNLEQAEEDLVAYRTRHCITHPLTRIFVLQIFTLAFFLLIGFITKLISWGGILPGVIAFATVALLATDITISLILMVNWYRTYYEISDQAIIYNRYFVFTTQKEVFSLNPNVDFRMTQGFLGKLINCGSITAFGPTIIKEVTLKNIPKPEYFLKTFYTLINQNPTDGNVPPGSGK